MRRQEKFGKVHFVLIALTLAFLSGLAVLAVREGAAAAGDAYRVKAEDGAATGDVYRVETEGAAATGNTYRAGTEGDVSTRGGEAAAPLDINAATAEELERLTGIGPVLAQAIVDYRAAHGPFRSTDELLAVSGIGEAKLGGIRDEVTVDGG